MKAVSVCHKARAFLSPTLTAAAFIDFLLTLTKIQRHGSHCSRVITRRSLLLSLKQKFECKAVCFTVVRTETSDVSCVTQIKFDDSYNEPCPQTCFVFRRIFDDESINIYNSRHLRVIYCEAQIAEIKVNQRNILV